VLFELKPIVAGVAASSGALALRFFPLACVALVDRSRRLGGRVVVVAAYLCIVVAAHFLNGSSPLWMIALGFLYDALVVCCIYWLGRLLRARRVTHGLVFVFAASAFLLFPAIVVPGAGLVALGWSMMLSSYSYCMDTRNRPVEPTLRECAFFILVNPVLVFSMRGTRVDEHRLSLASLVRAALGMLVFCASIVAVQPLASYAAGVRQASSPELGLTGAVAAYALLALLVEYGQQSGLASIYIGLMRQLGYVIPERFDYPLFARSPADFWRRWNTYVGMWLLRYTFVPLALRLRRRTSALREPSSKAVMLLGQAVAFIATFAIGGLLHDAYSYAVTFRIGTRALQTFVFAGAVAVVWACLAILAQRAASHFGVAASNSRLGLVSSFCSRVYMFSAALAFMVLWA
jgi:D-alanyl-lipoteichoic acid acyltransferase DltB (MBOAT superfamily)